MAQTRQQRPGVGLLLIGMLVLSLQYRLLLQRQQRQHALNNQFVTALLGDDTVTALALVNQGADPNTRLPSWANPLPPAPTAFQLACGEPICRRPGSCSSFTLHEDGRLVQAMIGHGANLDIQNGHQQTPLHIAACSHRLSTVELLLLHGAKVNAMDASGETPLMEAAASEATDSLPILLAHGANINQQDAQGQTALYIAVASNGSRHCLADLLRQGADPNRRANDGASPLTLVQRYKRLDIVRLLQQHGAK